jgi:hypothetical protein
MPRTTPISAAQRKLLDEYLRGKPGQSAETPNQIVRCPQEETAPLSLAQEELWLRELRVPGIPPLYNECITVHMAGPVNVAALEASLNEIIRRHEAWRTTFEIRQGQPVQIVQAATPIKMQVLDVRALPQHDREPEAIRKVGEDARRPFDLARGPLLRPTLVMKDDAERILFLVAHQIIIDGMSAYQIFPSELAAIYKAFSTGKPSPLPELPIQFADFTHWQREWLQDKELTKQVDYWRTQLAGDLRPLHWPCHRPRPESRSFRGSFQPFTLPGRLAATLRELSRREGGTLFTTLLAGFATLLHRYTGQEDIVVGTLAPAGRKRTEVQNLLGYFLNPVALRMNFRNDPAFRDLLRQARIVISDAISHDDVPIGLLARELMLKADSSRSPFFTVAISLQPPAPDLDLDWSVTSMDVENGGSNWDLYLAFIDTPTTLIGRAQYNQDLFDRQAITAMVDDLQRTLEIVALNPEQPLSVLHPLTPGRAAAVY